MNTWFHQMLISAQEFVNRLRRNAPSNQYEEITFAAVRSVGFLLVTALTRRLGLA